MSTEPAEKSTEPAAKPATKWQALRERWAVVRAQVAAWWAGADRWNEALGNHPFVVMGVVAALLVALFVSPAVLRWVGGKSAESRVASVSAVERVAPQAGGPAMAPAVVERVLIDHEDRLLRLENQLSARVLRPSARAVPASALGQSAAPAPVDIPAAVASPAWGKTDFDRAVDQFTLPSNFPALPSGANP